MNYPDADTLAPPLDVISQLAARALVELPDPWRAEAVKIALQIEDFAPDDMLEALDCDDPYELTGLYEGTPLTEKSAMDQPLAPDIIWLFRRPILEEWIDRGNVTLGELVTHVLVHELAHHFGWSDEDIATVDPWWE
jgi:predicted Zn-dependent protease with MMP-like domain